MNAQHQEREAKLLPVAGAIVGLYVVIMLSSYLIGTYVF